MSLVTALFAVNVAHLETMPLADHPYQLLLSTSKLAGFLQVATLAYQAYLIDDMLLEPVLEHSVFWQMPEGLARQHQIAPLHSVLDPGIQRHPLREIDGD